jgi:hypothetical protein
MADTLPNHRPLMTNPYSLAWGWTLAEPSPPLSVRVQCVPHPRPQGALQMRDSGHL